MDDDGERTHNVIDPDGRVRVCARQCDTCIFGKHSPVDRKRVEGMVKKATDGEGMIPCHHTLDDDRQNICRGFFNKRTVGLLQIAERLNYVTYYEPTNWRD